MKLLTAVVLLLFCHLTASAQKVWFIYLQTEPARPFYVKLNEKIYNSSATGYLILSRLRDSTYTLKIGINELLAEQKFTVSVNRKDRGYLIKDFGDKGWGLFDLQSMSVIMAETDTKAANEKNKVENASVSGFTDILSKATNDPSLKEKPAELVVIKEGISDTSFLKSENGNEDLDKAIAKNAVEKTVQGAEKAPDTLYPDAASVREKNEINTEENPKEKNSGTATPAETTQIEKNNTGNYQRSVIKRQSESSTTEGFGLVFTDENKGSTPDTIRILIPHSMQPVITAPEKKENDAGKRFLDIPISDSVRKEPEYVIVKEERRLLKPKNECPVLAEESDFLLLRKRMAAEMEDDKMIEESKKYFKKKCFTAFQIRNLSSLFLTDEGKYRFFDIAYTYVSDLENFPSLESELKDTYYINRFRAMLK